jgi:hypothetical protein
MADQRALDAIGRIDRALARIEASPRTASSPSLDELEAIRSAHQALRRRVIGAIGQIDMLLEAEPR